MKGGKGQKKLRIEKEFLEKKPNVGPKAELLFARLKHLTERLGADFSKVKPEGGDADSGIYEASETLIASRLRVKVDKAGRVKSHADEKWQKLLGSGLKPNVSQETLSIRPGLARTAATPGAIKRPKKGVVQVTGRQVSVYTPEELAEKTIVLLTPDAGKAVDFNKAPAVIHDVLETTFAARLAKSDKFSGEVFEKSKGKHHVNVRVRGHGVPEGGPYAALVEAELESQRGAPVEYHKYVQETVEQIQAALESRGLSLPRTTDIGDLKDFAKKQAVNLDTDFRAVTIEGTDPLGTNYRITILAQTVESVKSTRVSDSYSRYEGWLEPVGVPTDKVNSVTSVKLKAGSGKEIEVGVVGPSIGIIRVKDAVITKTGDAAHKRGNLLTAIGLAVGVAGNEAVVAPREIHAGVDSGVVPAEIEGKVVLFDDSGKRAPVPGDRENTIYLTSPHRVEHFVRAVRQPMEGAMYIDNMLKALGIDPEVDPRVALLDVDGWADEIGKAIAKVKDKEVRKALEASAEAVGEAVKALGEPVRVNVKTTAGDERELVLWGIPGGRRYRVEDTLEKQRRWAEDVKRSLANLERAKAYLEHHRIALAEDAGLLNDLSEEEIMDIKSQPSRFLGRAIQIERNKAVELIPPNGYEAPIVKELEERLAELERKKARARARAEKEAKPGEKAETAAQAVEEVAEGEAEEAGVTPVVDVPPTQQQPTVSSREDLRKKITSRFRKGAPGGPTAIAVGAILASSLLDREDKDKEKSRIDSDVWLIGPVLGAVVADGPVAKITPITASINAAAGIRKAVASKLGVSFLLKNKELARNLLNLPLNLHHAQIMGVAKAERFFREVASAKGFAGAVTSVAKSLPADEAKALKAAFGAIETRGEVDLEELSKVSPEALAKVFTHNQYIVKRFASASEALNRALMKHREALKRQALREQYFKSILPMDYLTLVVEPTEVVRAGELRSIEYYTGQPYSAAGRAQASLGAIALDARTKMFSALEEGRLGLLSLAISVRGRRPYLVEIISGVIKTRKELLDALESLRETKTRFENRVEYLKGYRDRHTNLTASKLRNINARLRAFEMAVSKMNAMEAELLKAADMLRAEAHEAVARAREIRNISLRLAEILKEMYGIKDSGGRQNDFDQIFLTRYQETLGDLYGKLADIMDTMTKGAESFTRFARMSETGAGVNTRAFDVGGKTLADAMTPALKHSRVLKVVNDIQAKHGKGVTSQQLIQNAIQQAKSAGGKELSNAEVVSIADALWSAHWLEVEDTFGVSGYKPDDWDRAVADFPNAVKLKKQLQTAHFTFTKEHPVTGSAQISRNIFRQFEGSAGLDEDTLEKIRELFRVAILSGQPSIRKLRKLKNIYDTNYFFTAGYAGTLSEKFGSPAGANYRIYHGEGMLALRNWTKFLREELYDLMNYVQVTLEELKNKTLKIPNLTVRQVEDAYERFLDGASKLLASAKRANSLAGRIEYHLRQAHNAFAGSPMGKPRTKLHAETKLPRISTINLTGVPEAKTHAVLGVAIRNGELVPAIIVMSEGLVSMPHGETVRSRFGTAKAIMALQDPATGDWKLHIEDSFPTLWARFGAKGKMDVYAVHSPDVPTMRHTEGYYPVYDVISSIIGLDPKIHVDSEGMWWNAANSYGSIKALLSGGDLAKFDDALNQLQKKINEAFPPSQSQAPATPAPTDPATPALKSYISAALASLSWRTVKDAEYALANMAFRTGFNIQKLLEQAGRMDILDRVRQLIETTAAQADKETGFFPTPGGALDLSIRPYSGGRAFGGFVSRLLEKRASFLPAGIYELAQRRGKWSIGLTKSAAQKKTPEVLLAQYGTGAFAGSATQNYFEALIKPFIVRDVPVRSGRPDVKAQVGAATETFAKIAERVRLLQGAIPASLSPAFVKKAKDYLRKSLNQLGIDPEKWLDLPPGEQEIALKRAVQMKALASVETRPTAVVKRSFEVRPDEYTTAVNMLLTSQIRDRASRMIREFNALGPEHGVTEKLKQYAIALRDAASGAAEIDKSLQNVVKFGQPLPGSVQDMMRLYRHQEDLSSRLYGAFADALFEGKDADRVFINPSKAGIRDILIKLKDKLDYARSQGLIFPSRDPNDVYSYFASGRYHREVIEPLFSAGVLTADAPLLQIMEIAATARGYGALLIRNGNASVGEEIVRLGEKLSRATVEWLLLEDPDIGKRLAAMLGVKVYGPDAVEQVSAIHLAAIPDAVVLARHMLETYSHIHLSLRRKINALVQQGKTPKVLKLTPTGEKVEVIIELPGGYRLRQGLVPPVIRDESASYTLGAIMPEKEESPIRIIKAPAMKREDVPLGTNLPITRLDEATEELYANINPFSLVTKSGLPPRADTDVSARLLGTMPSMVGPARLHKLLIGDEPIRAHPFFSGNNIIPVTELPWGTRSLPGVQQYFRALDYAIRIRSAPGSLEALAEAFRETNPGAASALQAHAWPIILGLAALEYSRGSEDSRLSGLGPIEALAAGGFLYLLATKGRPMAKAILKAIPGDIGRSLARVALMGGGVGALALLASEARGDTLLKEGEDGKVWLSFAGVMLPLAVAGGLVAHSIVKAAKAARAANKAKKAVGAANAAGEAEEETSPLLELNKALAGAIRVAAEAPPEIHKIVKKTLGLLAVKNDKGVSLLEHLYNLQVEASKTTPREVKIKDPSIGGAKVTSTPINIEIKKAADAFLASLSREKKEFLKQHGFPLEWPKLKDEEIRQLSLYIASRFGITEELYTAAAQRPGQTIGEAEIPTEVVQTGQHLDAASLINQLGAFLKEGRKLPEPRAMRLMGNIFGYSDIEHVASMYRWGRKGNPEAIERAGPWSFLDKFDRLVRSVRLGGELSGAFIQLLPFLFLAPKDWATAVGAGVVQLFKFEAGHSAALTRLISQHPVFRRMRIKAAGLVDPSSFEFVLAHLGLTKPTMEEVKGASLAKKASQVGKIMYWHSFNRFANAYETMINVARGLAAVGQWKEIVKHLPETIEALHANGHLDLSRPEAARAWNTVRRLLEELKAKRKESPLDALVWAGELRRVQTITGQEAVTNLANFDTLMHIAGRIPINDSFTAKGLLGEGATLADYIDRAWLSPGGQIANLFTGAGRTFKDWARETRLRDVMDPKIAAALDAAAGRLFTSWRLLTASYSLPNPITWFSLWKRNQHLAKYALKKSLKPLAGFFLYLYLLDRLGIVDVEWDPRSNDFLGVKFGPGKKYTINYFGPWRRGTVVPTQMITGQRKTAQGEIVDVGKVGGVNIGGRLAPLERTFYYALSPIASTATTLLRGKTPIGKEITWAPGDIPWWAREEWEESGYNYALKNLIIPIYYENVADSILEVIKEWDNEPLRILPTMADITYGFGGINTYEREVRPRKEREGKRANTLSAPIRNPLTNPFKG
jgi:hypothetical protein